MRFWHVFPFVNPLEEWRQVPEQAPDEASRKPRRYRTARLVVPAIAFALTLWGADTPEIADPELPAPIRDAALVLEELDEDDADGALALSIARDAARIAASDVAPEPAEPVAEAVDPADDTADDPRRRVVFVRRGDTLMDILLQVGLPRAEAHEAISSIARVFDPRALKPGQEITFTFAGGDDGANLVAAALSPTPEREFHIARGADGRFSAFKLDKTLSVELVRATGVVRTSLFEAGQAAGLPIGVLSELIRAFSYDVDFQREVQPGDSFDVVFERYRDDEGRLAKDGAIVIGALTLSGKTLRVWRHVARDGFADFYNERGESVRKALLKTPIDGAKLTSRFGARAHPILGYTAKHKGVDFGAADGTPIQAAGDGAIEAQGSHGGYGNYVRIRHNSEYSTAYAHLSRFASGLREGSRVRQGQVIGYVGSTGRSTGPHLHYEVVRRGTQINPMGVQLPSGRRLEGVDLIEFRQARARFEETLAALPPAEGRLAALGEKPAR